MPTSSTPSRYVANRRAVLLGTAGVIGATALQVTSAAAAPTRHPTTSGVPGDSLRALAAPSGLRIGTAINTDALANSADYRTIAAEQFSSVTPENVMKWDALEPTRGQYNWGPAETIVEFAREHDQLVRGHTLVWHNQLPDWLTSGNFSAAELRDLMEKHITDVVGHFRGSIWQWDVVNEAFNDDGTLRSTIWSDALGDGYIADAFRIAHRADPHALLFYNDYNIEGLGAKSDAVYDVVGRLRSEGVPIQGVGLQTHLDVKYPFPDRMPDNMRRFADRGLLLAITEADVRIPLPVDATKQLAQNADYIQTVQDALAIPECISYTVWGFSDAYSWVPGTFAGEGSACLYDDNLQPKPSYDAVQQTLALSSGAPPRQR